MELHIAQSAVSDLQEIKDYYQQQGVSEVGLELVEAILGHAQMLSDHPDSGRKVPEFNQPYIRELIHPPYRIVYLRQTESITLIRIWRSERLLKLPTNET